ncbi:MAG TPA: HD-GYP domain-containing protein [Solirubrobacteraceae bacterium]|jgi:ribonuclease P protein subunit RPR2|nr:HD-GYP domain-containing protein [Solirubrobacteraceae bacterium]
MSVPGDTAQRCDTGKDSELQQLRGQIERLQAELTRRELEAEDKERQLEIYAADVREIYKQERSRAQLLVKAYRATVTALANAVEARDRYTGKHAQRVAAYGMEILHRVDSRLADDPTTEFGFLLHDVGKVGIPDAILLKDGPLSKEERALMQQHPIIGETIVRDFLGDGTAVVRSHHERWDGRGYPDGLGGEEIPLPARAFAVADVLDALTSDRPYRPASPVAEARAMIVAQAGRQFDPQVVEAFQTIPDQRFEVIGEAVQ